MRIFYRVRQFWMALSAVPAPEDLVLAGALLSPAQMELFQRMQPSEQTHSLWIFRQLHQSKADQDPEIQKDLWIAALLHDVGKSDHPLRVWERVLIVLGEALFPELIQRWGCQSPDGWRRPFVVSVQHPRWGAEMAARAGTSKLAVRLIQHHHDRLEKNNPGQKLTIEDQLLRQLQRYDEER